MNKIYCKVGKIALDADEGVLPQNVLEHINKRKNTKSYLQSLSAWCGLEKLINETFSQSLKDCELSFSKRGKPLLKNFYISLSHTDEFYAVCVSKIKCGIDIEKMLKKDNLKEVSKYVFDEGIMDMKEFYKNWTRFESVSKLYDKNLLDVKNDKLDELYFAEKEFDEHYMTIASDEEFELLGL